jgi:hypothetical protein
MPGRSGNRVVLTENGSGRQFGEKAPRVRSSSNSLSKVRARDFGFALL